MFGSDPPAHVAAWPDGATRVLWSRRTGRHARVDPSAEETPALLAALDWPVEGLRWVPVTEPGPGPLVTRFWALILEKSL